MLDLLATAATSAVTLAVAAVVRAPGIPADVRKHDAKIKARDVQFETWTADRNHDLRRDCEALRATVMLAGDPDNAGGEPFARTTELLANAANRQTAAQADRAIAEAKSRALHEWRDESARADEYAAEILAAEGWAHRLYRRAARKPAPAMVGRKRAEPILTAWRKPSSISGERNTFPDDATKRTLDDAIASMPVTGP